MTTKVVKGSLWTLAGQVAPLGISLFTTPFTIRLLGVEGYGVLILIGLIPTYFAFADFGMGIASTRFASEAYAAGDSEKEARTVRTAALIALIVSIPIAAAIFIFSNAAIAAFNVPQNLQSEANLALKLASITFVINFLNSIFNTPQLTRLRMDLNTLVNSGFRMLGLMATPIVIYLGGGISGAVAILLLVALLTLVAHICVSGKLLNQLFQFTFDKTLIRPMLKFGGALSFAGIAAVLLVNLEKLVLAKVTTVEMLAHYSVAFTLAMIASMFSTAMIQSLVPAFSQLLNPTSFKQFQQLFSRCVTFSLLAFVPLCSFLALIAKPFFTHWAGEDFGRESTIPFYILLIGLLFNIPAYVPYSVLVALGRTESIAKLYWLELGPYVLCIYFLTSLYGIYGAAIAWSLRMIVDGIIFFILAKYNNTRGLRFLSTDVIWPASAICIYLLPVIMLLLFKISILPSLIVFGLSSSIFIWIVLLRILSADELKFIQRKVANLF
ncbi:MAG: oligosaccharide flippase family protein [Pyrinomonadaceae bacterium]